MIYLDHAASTPVKTEVATAMLLYLSNDRLTANPSSSHDAGREARAALESLRERVALHFDCQPAEVVFNSGGSEGDTHALVGTVRAVLATGNRRPRVVVGAIEHESVVQAARFCRELGAEVEAVPCDGNGLVATEALYATLRRFSPQIVSIMAVNNEIGTVQPVAQIAELCQEYGAAYHCDAVRAVGHGLGWIQRNNRVSMLSASAHKFGGPRGTGVLIVRHQPYRAAPASLICGGSQEHGLRAGTENLASAAGFAVALDLASAEEATRIEALRSSLEQRLRDRWPQCVIHGEDAPRATGVTSVALPGANGAELQRQLDERGIYVGVGSACHGDSSGVASPTLAAMGVAPDVAIATLRISLGWSTTQEEIDALFGALGELVR
ncbi:MAG: cysteine desulfurase [bacterium]|nr:cysteine desulfurase [bacterium]